MQDPEQTPKSKRWIIMLVIVVVAFFLYWIASYAINFKNTERDGNPPPGSSIDQNTQKSTDDIDRNQAPLAPSNNTSSNQQPVGQSIVDTNLLTAPVPQDATLAQEEISKLEDQQAQLTERKTLMQQQLADSDQLVELKQKYLADLQAQLDKSAA